MLWHYVLRIAYHVFSVPKLICFMQIYYNMPSNTLESSIKSKQQIELPDLAPTQLNYPISCHPMQTRSKSGIFIPKLLIASLHQEPTSVSAALANPEWQRVMEEEYQALLRNNTWVLVSSTYASHIVQSKWIFRTKFKVDGSLDKYKARLVAKGFQQTPGIDFFETFSPVVKASTIRIIFTLAVTKGWDIQQIDVNNAFMNGDLHEDVFISQPEGFIITNRPLYERKLHKVLYGLKQAPNAWFDTLKGALVTWGFLNSMIDTSLFFTHKHGRLLLLLEYVDDILVRGESSADIHQLIKDHHQQFALETLGPVSYFLGFEVTRDGSRLHLTQTKCATDLLHKTNMADSKFIRTPVYEQQTIS